MHVTKEDVDAVRRKWGMLANDDDAPDFKIRPISEAWRWSSRRPAYRTAHCNVAYIWRDASPMDRFGSMPSSFAERRFELRGAGLLLPASAPSWAAEPYRIWQNADAATAATEDPTAVSAWHVMMQIPDRLPATAWRSLVTGFATRELIRRGAAVAWAVHSIEADGGWIVAPHAHLIVTARHWRNDYRHGSRNDRWCGSWARQRSLQMAWRRACTVAFHTPVRGAGPIGSTDILRISESTPRPS
ncbi:MobA/MobL family protein [Sphingomonadaceae bacterium LXI357]|uniref:MobA/MobL family protein n=2 Tax=Stakelama marina TaxID=2826939 RepID=A0A8T4IH03_9SPHN|nr:MobA/MobL family protein [Stakelama marina]